MPPGGTYAFTFEWTAPADGTYDEFYSVVQEGVAWFGDPGQGGPPDNDIEARMSARIAVPRRRTAGDAASLYPCPLP